MRLVLGNYRDFSCKMSLATKIYLQTLVENTQFSSSVLIFGFVTKCKLKAYSLAPTKKEGVGASRWVRMNFKVEFKV